MIYSEVLATGGAVPERVVPNDFFTYLVEDADNWIFSRTGIRERRFASDSESTSDLATSPPAMPLPAGISTLRISIASSSGRRRPT